MEDLGFESTRYVTQEAFWRFCEERARWDHLHRYELLNPGGSARERRLRWN